MVVHHLRLLGSNRTIGVPRQSFELRQRTLRPFIHRLADLLLCPPLLLKDRHMLGTQHHHPVAAKIHRPHQRVGNRPHQSFARSTHLAVDEMGSLACEDRHRTYIGRYPALDAQRLPRVALLVFRDAIAILPGMSQATLIQHARNRAAHIHQNQPDRPSNRRVRPHTRPKTIDPIINVQLLHRRAIHDQQGSSAARRR